MCFTVLMELSKQYNDVADMFHQMTVDGHNIVSRSTFFQAIDFSLENKIIADLGCGEGADSIYYQKLGAQVYAIDSSEKFITYVKSTIPGIDARLGLMEQTDFESNFFDVVFSKYAIQTSPHVAPIFNECHRILKQGGVLMFLVTHPMRQFIEKKKDSKDYFKKEIVDSVLFGGAITVQEPTHTLSEYLTDDFLQKFDVISMIEGQDFPDSEQINNDIYPTFLIIKARKR